jgi:multiple sugar transport system substrate-binding protein
MDRVLPYLYRNHVGMTLIGSFIAARFPEAIATDMGFFAFPNYMPAMPAYEEAPLDVLVLPAAGLNPAARNRFLAFLAESGSLRHIAEADQTIPAQSSSTLSPILLGEGSSAILAVASGLTYFFDRDAKAELVAPAFEGMRQFLKAPHDTEQAVQHLEKARLRVKTPDAQP